MIKLYPDNFSLFDLFSKYFPDTLFAIRWEQGAVKRTFTFKTQDEWYAMFSELVDANSKGDAVCFIPNGIKDKRLNNRSDNFSYVNSWFLDLDVEETKHAKDPEAFALRETKMAEMAGRLMFGPVRPSIVIETRNGFQAFWLAKEGKFENFEKIEMGILDHFADCGGDRQTIKPVQFARVPELYNYKNGERVKMEIRWELCNRDLETGDFKRFTESEMIAAFPYTPPIIIWKLKEERPDNPDIDKAKNKNILFVASNLGLQVTKTNGLVKVLCPLHEEKTPSFTLFGDTNSFYCFGCSAHGDTIDLVQKLKNVGFTEAINYLNT